MTGESAKDLRWNITRAIAVALSRQYKIARMQADSARARFKAFAGYEVGEYGKWTFEIDHMALHMFHICRKRVGSVGKRRQKWKSELQEKKRKRNEAGKARRWSRWEIGLGPGLARGFDIRRRLRGCSVCWEEGGKRAGGNRVGGERRGGKVWGWEGSTRASPPPTPRRVPSSLPSQPLTSTSVPFPTASPASPTTTTSVPAKSPSAPIQRTSSSSSIVLANGRPLKPSLKSASSSSIADDMAANSSRHARAQSMPSNPFGSKNVHFKEKDDGLESVRLFRRTGKPASVSKTTSDTETETEPEPSNYPFPRGSKNSFASPSSSSLSEIASCSTIPASCPSPYANVHLESITLPPARPPVLRGTIIVRNIVFEKSVVVRFTLDQWTTVSEVLATYSGPVGALETLAGSNQGKTVGDLIGALPESTWDRFNFAIKLEDYETHLWHRTLFLVVRYSAPGAGEWWDNNSGDNYRITFRAHSGSTQPEHKRGATPPSAAPFLSICPPSPLTSRVAVHEEPRPTFSPPPRPPIIPRSISSPVPVSSNPGLRVNLRHYAAPAPLPRTQVIPVDAPRMPSSLEASRVVFSGQNTTPTTPETPTSQRKELIPDKDEVDEGFATGSEDGDNSETCPESRPQLSLNISSHSPAAILRASPLSPNPSPPPRQHGPFSPMREPFSPRNGAGGGDSYATLIREWCFAQGPDTFGVGATIGAQSAVPWVGGMS
ncbi:putative phosphatase regulatory subunit-domain-containing protein [Lactarius quietus]|nr:putative phosphatase regulatory subunit-domain-containing protein [Lactarius quietus]